MSNHSSDNSAGPIHKACERGGEVYDLHPWQVAIVLDARPDLANCNEVVFRCPLHGIVFAAIDDRKADLLLTYDVPVTTMEAAEATLEFAAQVNSCTGDQLTTGALLETTIE